MLTEFDCGKYIDKNGNVFIVLGVDQDCRWINWKKDGKYSTLTIDDLKRMEPVPYVEDNYYAVLYEKNSIPVIGEVLFSNLRVAKQSNLETSLGIIKFTIVNGALVEAKVVESYD